MNLLKQIHCITCTEMVHVHEFSFSGMNFKRDPYKLYIKDIYIIIYIYTFQISPSKNLDDFAQACFGQKNLRVKASTNLVQKLQPESFGPYSVFTIQNMLELTLE